MLTIYELRDYLEEFIEEKKEVKNITNATMKKQTINIKNFIKWLEKENIQQIDNRNIKRCLRKYRSYCLNERNNKRTTVKTYLLNVIDFLNYEEIRIITGHEKIHIKEIIEVKSENPDTARKRIEKISLTRKQTDFFLDTVKRTGNIKNYAICRTFIETGMRLKELVLLDKTDIKVPLNKQGLYILPNDKYEIIEVHLRAENTKGQYKSRTTFITYDTLVAINQMIMSRIIDYQKKKYQRDIIKVRKKRVENEINRQELFTAEGDRRFTRRGVQSLIKQQTKNCDTRIEEENIKCPINYFKNVSTHILRHTALSRYAEILTVAEVQTIAGHASSSTTDRYIHIDHSKIKEKIRMSMEEDK
ncbi:MAG: site-specific integrase [Clostridia bacterium]|nr:site-specific integrase [Clostridia bacterium]